jgi:NitT/TauT family transport system substrate-binding protein
MVRIGRDAGSRGRLSGAGLRRLRAAGVGGCVAAGIAVSVAGCGGSSEASVSSGGGKGGSKTAMTKITIGVLPLIDEATTYVALKNGYFSKHHLEATLKPMPSGEASVADIMNGQVQFASSSVQAPVIAKSKGLPLKVVAPQSDAGATPSTDSQSLIVAANGPKTLKELEGKTIAVGSLQNPGEFAVRADLEENGVNWSSIHVVAIEEPDMVATLKSGKIAAAVVSEPFVIVAKEAGIKTLIEGIFASGKLANAAKNIYYAKESYVNEAPEVAKEFSEAVIESNEAINENPELARQAASGFTEIEPSLLKKVVLPEYATAINCTSVGLIIKDEKEFGWITKEVTPEELLWSQAATTGDCS